VRVGQEIQALPRAFRLGASSCATNRVTRAGITIGTVAGGHASLTAYE